MPEIGTLSNKRISKLAGLAPLACDSGQMKGKRTVRGGRRTIREILFVVAAGVSRHNPDFRAFRERLAAAGKAKKVIRIALAHKLLVRLNAKAREVRQLQAARALTFSQQRMDEWVKGTLDNSIREAQKSLVSVTTDFRVKLGGPWGQLLWGWIAGGVLAGAFLLVGGFWLGKHW